jgi:hypothetical protein
LRPVESTAYEVAASTAVRRATAAVEGVLTLHASPRNCSKRTNQKPGSSSCQRNPNAADDGNA